jgi:GT2 family glycosyltransferase
MSETGVSSLLPTQPFGGRPLSIGVQAILFGNAFDRIERSVSALARSAELAIHSGACSGVHLFYGDSSPRPCLTDLQIRDLRARFGAAVQIEYQFFKQNLGSARGHNRVAESNVADVILFNNPDVVVAPRLLEVMLNEFETAGVGMVEAKQLPIEHPKDYDVRTGETCWATTACAMVPAPLFEALGGFDADAFFLYGDDVDLSWLIRLVGFKVIFQPAAIVFHDKRLNQDGSWAPSSAERYYSAEAALLLSYKWSRADLTERYLRQFKGSGADELVAAAEQFERRLGEGRLPRQLDANHRIGQFVDGMYAKHRFAL